MFKMFRRMVPIIGIVTSFVWMAFVYASFYLVQQQRPFGPANLQAILTLLLNVSVAGLITGIGLGTGSRICRWLNIHQAGLGEQVILGVGVGLGVLSLLILGIGLLGWIRTWVMLVLAAVLLIFAVPEWLRLIRQAPRSGTKCPLSVGSRFYLIASLALSLLVALTPPRSWDGLFYHLTMPQHYINHGRIAVVTDIPHQFYPGLMEMLYMLAMSLGSDVATQLLHWFYLLVLGGTIWLFADRYLPERTREAAILAFASMPMVFVLGSWAYNDLALAFYQLAALYALLQWIENRAQPWLILSAILGGFALGLKYTAFVCPLTLALLLTIWWVQRRLDRPQAIKALLLLSGVTSIVAAPWYVKNWVLIGNPVYPFAHGLFDGQGWDSWRTAWYARAGSGLGWNLGELVRLPWTLTLGLRDMNFYDGRTGPLFLLAWPFLLAWLLRLWRPASPAPPALHEMTLMAFVQIAFWTLGVVYSQPLFQSRLLLPALAALCVPLAYLFDQLRACDLPIFSLRRLVGMSATLVLAANLCYQGLDVLRIRPLPVLVGEESRDKFLIRNLGAYYAAMQLVNERASADDDRVLFLWEPRSYYCFRRVQPDPILDRWAWLRQRFSGDLTAIANWLHQEGYTYVLLHQAGLDFVSQSFREKLDVADLNAWQQFALEYLQPVDSVGNAYQLYLLKNSTRRAD